MTDVTHYARAAGDPEVIAAIAAQVVASWDPRAEFTAPDGERSALSHARTIAGILGTGLNEAAVMGYLRHAEEAALGAARSTGRERRAIAVAAWRLISDAVIRATT